MHGTNTSKTCSEFSLAPMLVFSLLVVLTLGTAARAQTTETSENRQEVASPTVSLTIDYGDGAQKRFPKIAWSKRRKGTVADVLAYAEKHDRGIQITARGKGETRFLESIDGLENEGSGGKNWMFLVNGELGQSSYATTWVEPGADVLWEFRTIQ